MENSQKFVVKTTSNKTYLLHIIDAEEYDHGKYVGLFLYYDGKTPTKGLQNMMHRVLFGNSVEDIKDKVVEYANTRGESVIFVENTDVLI